ncbi:NADH-quinone oxidoreductase subunit L [Paremcibacter congregatus]|uniref:NADH-ubiquinone oxidoreductase chain 5 n=1 Tax=Paremcibacter congregatus TaxID=2043170 RepID=A0A2G4YSP8_9PROT|nr:NADH-quinone oxidoreductase subunit L [Paremcibacter congregatus]PHZ85323.1 NADH-quinone oxidoreductase subunit L [Paremcibacter congregatus]QDE27745.1 NADH-quinone oxidoreductase subunit L [Paremcibacter congregatus]
MYQIIVFGPLLAAIIAGLFGRKLGDKGAQAITCGALILSAILSWVAFFQIGLGHTVEHVTVMNWVTSGDLSFNWAFKVDTLTAVMLVVVNTVSCLVHIYSVGYMSHDPHKPRFMAYLSLFTFAMLMLVTADNFVQMFFGWEGVGLASYLLIGFWYKKPSACAAAIKAFLVNRVGDFGFALGILLVFMATGSVDFETVFAKIPELQGQQIHFLWMELDLITTMCILLFIGAMGKSAQLGLHTWLPDAMEGPTPVSALIHAATMVTAGVFMVARCSPIFEFSPDALAFVTLVGASTAIFAATIGTTQNDIKRVIAYSTCSQLGYMFFALGVSAYGAAIFHLFTHAFFKALLFLGSGSVIHAMSDEQDMRKMGGLWNKIPITFAMMTIGTLALTGFPFLAGFYSKDMIIESAFAANNPWSDYAFFMGVFAALLTSFYSWRLVFMTFFGKSRASQSVQDHVHESTNWMLVPLYVLAAGALAAGFVFKENFVGHHYEDFWGQALFLKDAAANVMEAAHHVPGWVVAAPFVVMVLGFLGAIYAYIWKPETPAAFAGSFRYLYNLFYNKWYIDEIYDFLFVEPAKKIGVFLWKKGDENVIDRFGPDGAAASVMTLARRFKALQSGYVYHYAFAMLMGVAAFVTWFIGGAS